MSDSIANPPNNDSNKPVEEVSPEDTVKKEAESTAEAEAEVTAEEEYDDTDYSTKYFMKFLVEPPLLPHEDLYEFDQLVDDIATARPKSVTTDRVMKN